MEEIPQLEYPTIREASRDPEFLAHENLKGDRLLSPESMPPHPGRDEAYPDLQLVLLGGSSFRVAGKTIELDHHSETYVANGLIAAARHAGARISMEELVSYWHESSTHSRTQFMRAAEEVAGIINEATGDPVIEIIKSALPLKQGGETTFVAQRNFCPMATKELPVRQPNFGDSLGEIAVFGPQEATKPQKRVYSDPERKKHLDEIRELRTRIEDQNRYIGGLEETISGKQQDVSRATDESAKLREESRRKDEAHQTELQQQQATFDKRMKAMEQQLADARFAASNAIKEAATLKDARPEKELLQQMYGQFAMQAEVLAQKTEDEAIENAVWYAHAERDDAQHELVQTQTALNEVSKQFETYLSRSLPEGAYRQTVSELLQERNKSAVWFHVISIITSEWTGEYNGGTAFEDYYHDASLFSDLNKNELDEAFREIRRGYALVSSELQNGENLNQFVVTKAIERLEAIPHYRKGLIDAAVAYDKVRLCKRRLVLDEIGEHAKVSEAKQKYLPYETALCDAIQQFDHERDGDFNAYARKKIRAVQIGADQPKADSTTDAQLE